MQAARGTSLSDARRPDVPSRRGRTALLAAVSLGVLAVDQGTKALAVALLSDHDPVELVPHVLQLRLIRNAGAAFGIAQGGTLLLSLVAVTVIIVILRTARTLRVTSWAVALGLLLGGAVGNLVDRATRSPGFLRGHVVDFLELPNFPIFNGADSAICVGAALMVVLSLRGSTPDGSHLQTDDRAGATSGPQLSAHPTSGDRASNDDD